MNIQDPKNPVRKEQFGNNAENTSESHKSENHPENVSQQGNKDKEHLAEDNNEAQESKAGSSSEKEKGSESDINETKESGEQLSEKKDDTLAENKEVSEEEGADEKESSEKEKADAPSGEEKKTERAEIKEEKETDIVQDTPEQEKKEPGDNKNAGNDIPSEDKKNKKETKKEDKKADEIEKAGKRAADNKRKIAGEKQQEINNYALLSREDLVKVLEELINTKSVHEIREDVDAIRFDFYKKFRNDIDQLKEKFIREGGKPEDFSPPPDPQEEKVKGLLNKYQQLKAEHKKNQEEEKEEHLRKKYEVIDEIADLINKDESINKTFQEFRELQQRWREIGIVPQKNLKHLWENYHYHVEKFYDYIKINKELRDLDLKKNLEAKLDLCEKAEALLLEPNIINAFQTLQKFHDQWREIGPAPKEKRSEIWERFREATSKINKKHQKYYQDLKESQKQNLESKTVLCEKAEELANLEINSHEEWVNKTNKILELQKVWKTIGFAPKKDNNKIYARFRTACDQFFEKKRKFYAKNLENQQENLQKKLDLCVHAESLQDSTDWKKTTSELINLQKKWKKIGPVPRKQSDEIWKRFRAACDKFFDRKSEYFSNIDTRYEKNLEAKEELIREIEGYQLSGQLKEDLSRLNEFQRRWSKIGFVPYNKKDEIMQRYREAINVHYDNLELDDHKKNVLKFKNKLDNIKQKSKPDIKLRFEREKLMNKLQQLKNDISVWENNIGFFADTENAESMVKDFEHKIKNARDKIKLLEDKIIMIDEMDAEE